MGWNIGHKIIIYFVGHTCWHTSVYFPGFLFNSLKTLSLPLLGIFYAILHNSMLGIFLDDKYVHVASSFVMFHSESNTSICTHVFIRCVALHLLYTYCITEKNMWDSFLNGFYPFNMYSSRVENYVGAILQYYLYNTDIAFIITIR